MKGRDVPRIAVSVYQAFARSSRRSISAFISACDAPAASRFAVKSKTPENDARARNPRTMSRHRRLMRLRTFARGETFFDTTHALCRPAPLGEAARVSEKYAPPMRLREEWPMISKSRRESRCRRGIVLDREASATFPPTARECVFATCSRRTLHVPVRTGALLLFWLPCSSHGPHYTHIFLLHNPNVARWHRQENIAR